MQSNWSYDRNGADFNANIGNLLSDDAYLQVSIKTEYKATLLLCDMRRRFW